MAGRISLPDGFHPRPFKDWVIPGFHVDASTPPPSIKIHKYLKSGWAALGALPSRALTLT